MKIKKILIILLFLFVLTGCTKVKDLSIDEIIDNVTLNEKKSPNVYRNGYKFYLPKGMQVRNAGSNFIVLSDDNYNYYLYVDFVSYDKKSEGNYQVNNNAFYSSKLSFDNLDGYIEINLKENDKYLIEIMYNYAKIEVMVDINSINRTLINTINILKSIDYNATIIEKLLNDDNLDYTEEVFDIFENSNDNSNVLEHEDDYEEVEDYVEEEEVKDTDFLN